MLLCDFKVSYLVNPVFFEAGRLEDIFDNENLSKIVKALTFNKKWVLSLYYIEEKTDEEIGMILFMTKSAVTKKK